MTRFHARLSLHDSNIRSRITAVSNFLFSKFSYWFADGRGQRCDLEDE